MGRELSNCVPFLQSTWVEGQKQCREIGLDIRISCTTRSLSQQVAYYFRGRAPLVLVNMLYTAAGEKIITEAQNRRTITNVLDSKHLVFPPNRLQSRAIDFFISYDGKAMWDVKADLNNDNLGDYQQVGGIFEKLGCVSGRRWNDFVHIEAP